jgi:DNA invertase Pin-like site-specific DNA recombinase
MQSSEEAIKFLDEYLIYLRKSRNDGEKVPVEVIVKRHEEALQELAERELGFKIPEKNIYREIVSGGESIEDRPEFIKVLQRLEVGNIKGVFVFDPHRLSRSGLYGAGDVLEAFEVTQTLICTPMKFYNLDDKMDKKYLEMIMIQAAEYLNYAKDVMDAGRMKSFAEGKAILSTPPYGYGKEKISDEKGYKLIPNPVEAPNVKKMFELCCEGLGTTAIANYLNERNVKPRKKAYWEPTTIRDMLKNETYIGILTWGKNPIKKILQNGKARKKRFYNQEGFKVAKGLYEPLVTKEQFELAQEMMKSRRNREYYNNGIKNPLAGLVFCGYCGNAMIRRPYNKSFRKNLVRVYEIDKQELLDYLRAYKQQSNLSLTEIAKRLNVTRDVVVGWFPAKLEKFYPSKTLADKWFDLKTLLDIKDDKFDKEVTTYKEPDIQKDSLICSSLKCNCVSSYLEIVENGLIDKLKNELYKRKHFLDNYEQELKKEKVSNEKELKEVEKKIEEIQGYIKNAAKKNAMDIITDEQFLDLKEEFETELNPLLKKKEKLADTKDEERIIQYRRSIPVLERCVSDYHLLSIEEKNRLLKSFIDRIEYKKEVGGRWNKEAINQFELAVETYDF